MADSSDKKDVDIEMSKFDDGGDIAPTTSVAVGQQAPVNQVQRKLKARHIQASLSITIHHRLRLVADVLRR